MQLNCPLNKVNGLKWTPEDLSKKFSEAYVRATINGDHPYSGLVYINHAAVVLFNANQGVNYTCWENVVHPKNGVTVKKQRFDRIAAYDDFILVEDRPPACLTNYKDTTFLFTYNPARQWKRGFHNHNSYLLYPSSENQNGWEATARMDHEVAEKILTPEHTPVDQAIEEIRSGTAQARALSNRYQIVKRGDALTLYSRRTPLGSFVGKRFFPGEGARLLLDEISNELPELKINGKSANQ